MDTIVNHINAVNIIITEITIIIYIGVEFPITKVKRLRKKRVALGFRTLVKNPILNA